MAYLLRLDPSQRLLDVLRETLGLTGTKEGCGKGECGACTVLMDGRTVDSCLVMAYQADGSDLWTIEGLGRRWQEQCRGLDNASEPVPEKGPPRMHPVQKAFVECGSSQCGICIPGMIMAATDLLERHPNPSRDDIRYGLAGNLCRCTGYVKIFDAVQRASAEMRFVKRPALRRVRGVQEPHRSGEAHTVTSLKEALRILSQNRRRTKKQIAGGTDALVQAKDGVNVPAEMFDIFRIKELRGIRERASPGRKKRQNGEIVEGEIWIGAATTFTEARESSLLQKFAPALVEACAVVGGPQIRNRGTLGGNFANASPAADSVPALMSMGTILEIVSAKSRREIPAEKFFTGPGKTVLKRDELIAGFRIPKMKNVLGCYLRLAQRQAQAISKVDVAVTAVLSPQENGGHPAAPFAFLGICYGSVAPAVFRALKTENILKKNHRNRETLRQALEAIKKEVRPIDDIRSSAAYRREMSAVLLERALQKIGLIQ